MMQENLEDLPTRIQDIPEAYVGDLNTLVDICHGISRSKGWHDKDLPERTFGDIIALCHSELSEALEEYRDGHAVDEIYYTEGLLSGNKPEGVPIELADVLIRIFDFCGKENIDLMEAFVTKVKYNETRSHRHGNKVI